MFLLCKEQGGPGSVRFGYGLGMERFKRLRFSVLVRFLWKEKVLFFFFFSVFQRSLTGKDGSGKTLSTIAILWLVKAIFEKRAATVEVYTLISPETVPAVPVPLSVSGKTVLMVPVSGSGSVPEPP